MIKQRGEAFADKHAVVTGGARGVGRQVALQLAEEGAHVTVVDLDDARDTVSAIAERGGSAEGMQVDVRDRLAVRDIIDRAATSCGSLDVLTTLAGVYGDSTKIDDLDETEVQQVMSVNFNGTLWTIQASLPHLRLRGGSIVCVGSVAGKIGGILAGPHYAASKGAVHALVRAVAKAEAESEIRVNGVAPGAINTEMITGRGYSSDYCPLGRIADPAEVARVVVFLASTGASYMTGAIVDVNGGFYFD